MGEPITLVIHLFLFDSMLGSFHIRVFTRAHSANRNVAKDGARPPPKGILLGLPCL